MKSFICRGCSNPVISTGHTSVDIGASANLEVMDKFCYLGDMLSVDGDADAALEARIRSGWNTFRQLVPFCLPIGIYHWLGDGGCMAVVCEVDMVTTWKWDLACQEIKWGGTSASRDENGYGRWLCNVKVKDRVPSKELRERLGIDDIILILQQNRLR